MAGYAKEIAGWASAVAVSSPTEARRSALDAPESILAYNWAWIVASISLTLILEAASFAAANILAYGEF